VEIPVRRRTDHTRIQIAVIVREVGWVAPAATIRASGTKEREVAVGAAEVVSRTAIRTVNGAADPVEGPEAVQAAGKAAAAAPE